jgi:hypothetical protein
LQLPNNFPQHSSHPSHRPGQQWHGYSPCPPTDSSSSCWLVWQASTQQQFANHISGSAHDKGKAAALHWVGDGIYRIFKLAKNSWKRQLGQNARWFCFQCVRCLSNILLSYFNFVHDPEVDSAAAKDIMPVKDNAKHTMSAKDNRALEDIANSFQQLCLDIKSASMVNGDGQSLADSPPPQHGGLPNKGTSVQKSKASQTWRQPGPSAALLSPRPHKSASSSRANSSRQQRY